MNRAATISRFQGTDMHEVRNVEAGATDTSEVGHSFKAELRRQVTKRRAGVSR